MGVENKISIISDKVQKTKMPLSSIENLSIRKENSGVIKNVKKNVKDITETKMIVKEATREPLLAENPNRFVILPIQYNDIWMMYKRRRQASGLQKKLTWNGISETGMA